MLTDSAQTVIALMFSELVITDIVGNTLVCVVLIKNQEMKWASKEEFELLFSPSNLQQFSLKYISLRSIELLRDQAVFYYPGQILLHVFQTIEAANEKEKTLQTTSVCILLITYKYIYSRVKHKSRLLSLFVLSLYCYQVSKKGITTRESGDIQYTFILIINNF